MNEGVKFWLVWLLYGAVCLVIGGYLTGVSKWGPPERQKCSTCHGTGWVCP